MGSRWSPSNTIEQSESRHSSSDFISGVSSSTKSGVDASSGPQRGTQLRVVAEVTNQLMLRISLKEENVTTTHAGMLQTFSSLSALITSECAVPRFPTDLSPGRKTSN